MSNIKKRLQPFLIFVFFAFGESLALRQRTTVASEGGRPKVPAAYAARLIAETSASSKDLEVDGNDGLTAAASRHQVGGKCTHHPSHHPPHLCSLPGQQVLLLAEELSSVLKHTNNLHKVPFHHPRAPVLGSNRQEEAPGDWCHRYSPYLKC